MKKPKMVLTIPFKPKKHQPKPTSLTERLLSTKTALSIVLKTLLKLFTSMTIARMIPQAVAAPQTRRAKSKSQRHSNIQKVF